MVPGRKWNRIPREERQDMVRRGFSKQVTKDTCQRCYTRERKLTYTPPPKHRGYLGIPKHLKQVRRPGGVIVWVGERPKDKEEGWK